MYTIYPCSEEARVLVNKKTKNCPPVPVSDIRKYLVYPFIAMHVGESFAVPYDAGVTIEQIEKECEYLVKRDQWDFAFIKHDNLRVLEVVRLHDKWDRSNEMEVLYHESELTYRRETRKCEVGEIYDHNWKTDKALRKMINAKGLKMTKHRTKQLMRLRYKWAGMLTPA